MLRTAGLLAVVALATPTLAQVPPQPAPTELETVVVDGRRLADVVEQFVDDIVAPPVGRGPSRWDRKVCVGVANVRAGAAQVIIDQVSRIALEVGLEPAEPGCSPNILVIGTNDGEAMARGLIGAKRRAFLPFYSGGSRSALALERFQASDAAVRWWHVGVPVNRYTSEIAVRLPGREAPFVRQDGSRLTTQIQNNLLRAFIIVDLAQMEGINFHQLGDYVGMVAMAQIDPAAATGAYDTVLNLFSGAGTVQGLTAWDRAYLNALYSSELNQRAPSHQGGEIAGEMLRGVRTGERASRTD